MSEATREEKLRLLKRDSVIFAKYILNFNPFPYQEALLRDPSKRIIACMGRQTGKSTTIAAKAVHFAVARGNRTSLVVSATMRQSQLMFSKILDFVLGSILAQSVSYKSRTQVVLRNRSRIIALPCGQMGHTLRGHTAHLLILDEAAFIPQEVITNVALPMISATNGDIWMISTPWDKDHIFYRVFNRRDWSVYHFPSRASPLVTEPFLAEQRELIGEERFAMEYEAEFLDDVRAYFPMPLLRGCVEDYEPQPTVGGRGGYDPGGKSDFAAFAVVAKEGDRWRVTYLRQAKGLTYSHFTTDIADYHRKYPLTKLSIDATSMGPIVEHAAELGLPAEGFNLSQPLREELLGHLKLLLEQRRISLPHDLALLNSLNCIECERTYSGHYKFEHRAGTHDDLAYALALAVYPGEQEERSQLVRL